MIYDPDKISLESLLKVFWECHDPTQGDRQGNDIGSQYRSVIYCESEQQLEAASKSLELFNKVLTAKGFPKITTEIAMSQPSFVAEEYHQQYLAKNPNGYCGIKGTGCVLPPL